MTALRDRAGLSPLRGLHSRPLFSSPSSLTLARKACASRQRLGLPLSVRRPGPGRDGLEISESPRAAQTRATNPQPPSRRHTRPVRNPGRRLLPSAPRRAHAAPRRRAARSDRDGIGAAGSAEAPPVPRAALAVQQTEGNGGVTHLHKTARRAPLRNRAPTGQRGPARRPPRGCSPPRSWLEQRALSPGVAQGRGGRCGPSCCAASPSSTASTARPAARAPWSSPPSGPSSAARTSRVRRARRQADALFRRGRRSTWAAGLTRTPARSAVGDSPHDGSG